MRRLNTPAHPSTVSHEMRRLIDNGHPLPMQIDPFVPMQICYVPKSLCEKKDQELQTLEVDRLEKTSQSNALIAAVKAERA